MDLSGFEYLKLEEAADGRVLLLELNHGKANEMGSGVLREFERLVELLRSEDQVAALVTFSKRASSKGTPIFVAGANVTERVGWDDDQVKAHVRWQRAVLNSLKHAPVFHVAVVNGVALGWGTEYLLTADYRIGGPRSVYGLPETGLGILPGAGGTSELWAHIGVAHALRLGMTGERIGPDEAMRIGLIQEIAESVDAGLERAMSLAARAAKVSPTAAAAFKRGVLCALGMSAEERVEREARAYEFCVDTGQAAVGRKNFANIRAGEAVPWGTRRLQE